jgi:hypothetical protein
MENNDSLANEVRKAIDCFRTIAVDPPADVEEWIVKHRRDPSLTSNDPEEVKIAQRYAAWDTWFKNKFKR